MATKPKKAPPKRMPVAPKKRPRPMRGGASTRTGGNPVFSKLA